MDMSISMSMNVDMNMCINIDVDVSMVMVMDVNIGGDVTANQNLNQTMNMPTTYESTLYSVLCTKRNHVVYHSRFTIHDSRFSLCRCVAVRLYNCANKSPVKRAKWQMGRWKGGERERRRGRGRGLKSDQRIHGHGDVRSTPG